jgi:hypothetical protein
MRSREYIQPVPVLVAKTVKCDGLKDTSKEVGSDLKTMCRIRNSATRLPESTRPNDNSRLLLSQKSGCVPVQLEC